MATSDGFTAVKQTKIVETALALLEREVVLPNLVWKDAVSGFEGAANDTISIRLPAFLTANVRDLRSSDARVRSKAEQRKVDVTLDKDLQVDIELSDEEYTLDIVSLARDVISPAMDAIVRGYEDEVATLIEGATYNTSITINEAAPYHSVVDARKALNDANVPFSGRALVVGSSVEAAILKDDQFAEADKAGDSNALRDAMIGRIAGFNVFTSNAITPTKAFAFHRTAYALVSRAPVVPRGAAWGSTLSRGGFAIRVLEHLDASTDIIDVLACDAWVGSSVVEDRGEIDANGKFVPMVDAESGDDLFVRAVELELVEESSS